MSLCFHGYILAISALTYCWSYPCGPDHGMNKPLWPSPEGFFASYSFIYINIIMHYKYYNV
jgi:hypothetical protein